MKVKGVEIESFTFFIVIRRGIFFIYQNFYLSDRFPLSCAELGTAQPQLVLNFCSSNICSIGGKPGKELITKVGELPQRVPEMHPMRG